MLLTLEELGVPYKGEVVNIHKFEQCEPWFLQMNPDGKVPVLKDGEEVITGSTKILQYLDENYNSGT